MMSPEGYEKTEIKRYLLHRGIWHFSPYTAGFGKSGVPDIVGCRAGKLFGIEVKREGKGLTTLQARVCAAIETAGGKTFWGTAEKVIPEFEAWTAR
jgi:Holliday junction resolvase